MGSFWVPLFLLLMEQFVEFISVELSSTFRDQSLETILEHSRRVRTEALIVKLHSLHKQADSQWVLVPLEVLVEDLTHLLSTGHLATCDYQIALQQGEDIFPQLKCSTIDLLIDFSLAGGVVCLASTLSVWIKCIFVLSVTFEMLG
jgi:hypothetical protein